MKSTAKKKLFINNMITLGMVVAAWIIMEVLMGTGHVSSLLKGLLVPFCIYVIMAVSLNLTVGILGELSLGHAGFMCVGAFSGALFSKCMKGAIDPTVSLVIAIFVGAAVAAVFGILIGIPVLRLRGDYLAIVTLAFGEIIKNLVNAVFLGRDADGFHISFKDSMSLGLKDGGEVLIKGPQGITGTPQAATFTIGIILVLITLIIVMNLVNSRTGRAIMSIRDNRIAAESIGINITKYKLLAFSISAALAGVAGVLYAHNLTTLTALPKNFLEYNKLGVYKLLADIHNQSLTTDFLNSTLGPILDYDAVHHTDYLHILEVYFDHDCSIIHTADALYCHKNTLSYKLNKIKELLDYDILTNENRTNIMLSFYILRLEKRSI